MYTLAEIKKICRQYMLRDGEIEPTGREKVKSLSEMTEEEKSYIGSALFLFRQLSFKFQKLSDEEFLKQMQEQFISEALKANEYEMNDIHEMMEPAEMIWERILSKDPLAMTYFKRALGENGKKLQNFQWEEESGLIRIKYDLIEDNKNKFHQRLNPNNPIYESELEPKPEPNSNPIRLADDEKILKGMDSELEPKPDPDSKPADDANDTQDRKSGRLTREQIDKILRDEDNEKRQMEKILKGMDDKEELER